MYANRTKEKYAITPPMMMRKLVHNDTAMGIREGQTTIDKNINQQVELEHLNLTIGDRNRYEEQTLLSGPDWPNAESALAATVPHLPDGKRKHLFISHSSKDSDEVSVIVNELECRFNVSCVVADRDFKSGKEVLANIKDSMETSLKTVFMLTPNFIQSNFCRFERNFAFMTSIENGINCVIPVLLKECDIPFSMATFTYIDGTFPGVDIPAKITQALAQSELVDQRLMIEDHVLTRRYENGYCVPIKSEAVHVRCFIRPAQFVFSLSDEVLSHLSQANIKLPRSTIEGAIDILNKGNVIHEHEYYKKCRIQCICVILVWLLLLAPSVTPWIISSNDEVSDLVVPFFVTLVILGLVHFFVTVTLGCVCLRFCKSMQGLHIFQEKIWELIGDTCIENNTIVFVKASKKSTPTLHIMRYNITQCKVYLAGLIRSRERRGLAEQSTSPEIRAKEQIKRAIERLLHHLTPSLEELPDAPCNRHNVRKSKMCLCQMIEAGSPLVI